MEPSGLFLAFDFTTVTNNEPPDLDKLNFVWREIMHIEQVYNDFMVHFALDYNNGNSAKL
jgi:hypothetical protein